jgi:hypothetical protein
VDRGTRRIPMDFVCELTPIKIPTCWHNMRSRPAIKVLTSSNRTDKRARNDLVAFGSDFVRSFLFGIGDAPRELPLDVPLSKTVLCAYAEF